jgi:hypothetical protein
MVEPKVGQVWERDEVRRLAEAAETLVEYAQWMVVCLVVIALSTCAGALNNDTRVEVRATTDAEGGAGR